jgi:carboxyl-terminal processing protease
VIIGQRTYGKGLVQQTKQLIYNAQIKVTVAKYYIPSGRCVQALDYSNRDEEGRVEKVPDSLITAFKTKGGRIVYDGAGIMPDVKTEEEKFEDILLSLISKHHIFNYATEYVVKHNEIAGIRDFALTDSEYADFIIYLKDKDYNYKTREEIELEEFKKDVEEEKGFEAIKPEYEALANKLKNNKKDDLEQNKALIKKYLEEEIVSRYYFQKGRIEFSLRHDDDLKEAQKILADNGKMKTILTQVEKPTKPFNVKKKF